MAGRTDKTRIGGAEYEITISVKGTDVVVSIRGGANAPFASGRNATKVREELLEQFTTNPNFKHDGFYKIEEGGRKFVFTGRLVRAIGEVAAAGAAQAVIQGVFGH